MTSIMIIFFIPCIMYFIRKKKRELKKKKEKSESYIEITDEIRVDLNEIAKTEVKTSKEEEDIDKMIFKYIRTEHNALNPKLAFDHISPFVTLHSYKKK